MKFEFNALNLSGIVKGLRAAGVLPALLDSVSAPLKQALESPFAERWYQGELLTELWMKVGALHGWQKVEDINFDVTMRSLGPVVRPLIRVALALTDASPAAVFSRMGSLASTAIRNVEFGWEAQSKTSGAMWLRYPDPVPPPFVEHCWAGIFRTGSELVGKPVKVERFEVSESERRFTFHLSW